MLAAQNEGRRAYPALLEQQERQKKNYAGTLQW